MNFFLVSTRCLTGLVIILCCCLLPSESLAEDAQAIQSKQEICKSAKQAAAHLSCQELQAMIDGDEEFVLLDIRTKTEFDAGHIAGAIWLPRGFLEFKIEEVVADPDAKIVVYCLKGCRGSVSALALVGMGYRDVRDLTGGLVVWMQEKRPLQNMYGTISVLEWNKQDPWPQ